MASKKSEKKTAAPSGPGRGLITSVANAGRHATKLGLQASWNALVAGIVGNYDVSDKFATPEGLLPRDEVVGRLHRFIDAAEATKRLRKEYLASVQDERHVLAELRPLHDSIVAIVRGRYGKSSQILLQFGITPMQPQKKSAAAKSVAVQKALATREARGTRGRRQRLAIHGTLPSPEPAPAAKPEAADSTAPASPMTAPAAPQPGAAATVPPGARGPTGSGGAGGSA
jgi:hypothetical protein